MTDYAEITPLYSDASWEISVSGNNWQKVSLPFFADDIPAITVKCTFADTSKQPLYLISYGIKGIAHVYLNNTLIHYQPNNQSPFKIKLKQDLLKQQNELKIIIHRPLKGDDGFPQFVRQFKEKYSLGIIRPIFLAKNKLNDIEIKKIMLAKEKNDFYTVFSYQLNIRSKFPKMGRKVTVEEELLDKNNKRISIRLFSIDTTSIKELISSKAKIPESALWDIQNPQRIKLKITLKKNYSPFFRSEKFFALRDLSYKENRFWLNGKRITIKGVNYYETLYRYQNIDIHKQVKKDLIFLKNSGFNAIRFPHYIPGKFLVQTADSLGLLLFAELPLQRLPKELFLNDNLLENSILSLDQLANFYNNNPSFAAISLGQEITPQNPAAQKFLLILKGIVSGRTNFLSYMSPIPKMPLPAEKLADFYILDIYRPIASFKGSLLPYALAGKIGFITPGIISKWDKNISSQKHFNFINQEYNYAISHKNLNGGFIESFSDWKMEYPLASTINSEDPFIFPSGFFSINNTIKSWASEISSLLQIKSYTKPLNYPNTQSTNFFSILLFFASIFFFTFVRRHYRLRENLKRSINHSYGFFVDIRERRIIPIFNSILVGIFIALIIAAFIASYVYYYHNSVWMQEIISVFLVKKNYFNTYLSISSSPAKMTLFFSIILIIFPFIVSPVLKFFSFFSRERFRFRQGVAIAFWSAIPFLFMLPVSFAAYHLLKYQNMQVYLLYIFILFFIWTQFRLINGIRVLFIVKMGKVFIWMLVSYLIPLVTLWFLLNPEHFWIEYLKLLFSSSVLF
jgi:hypothetical protein